MKHIFFYFSLYCFFVSSILTIGCIVQSNYGLFPFYQWVISIILVLVVTFILSKEKSFRFPNIRQISHETLTIFGVLVLVFILRITYVRLFPIYFHGDEAIISRNAENLVNNIFFEHNWNLLGGSEGTLSLFPSLWYVIQGLFIKLFGPNLVSIKTFSLVTDILMALVVYLFVRKFNGKKLAQMTLPIYLCFPILIHFSLTGYQNIQTTFLLYLAILFVDNKSPIKLTISGIITGLSFYFYLSAAINPLIVLIVIIFFCFSSSPSTIHNRITETIKSVFYWIIGLIVTLIPYVTYSISKYNFLLGRSEAIIKNFNFSLIMLQINETFQCFLPTGKMNGSGYFYPDLPLIPNWFVFIIFLFGLIYLLAHFYKPLPFISLTIGVVTLMFGGLLTDDPPASQRLIHLYPVVTIIIAFGLSFLTNIFGHVLKLKNRYWVCRFFIFVILITMVYNFTTQNIPVYKKYTQIDAVYLANFIPPKQKLYSIYKKDMIYYYSRGKINQIDNFSCQSLSEEVQKVDLLFFIFEKDFSILDNCPTVSSSIIKEWFTPFDHTYLLKLTPSKLI